MAMRFPLSGHIFIGISLLYLWSYKTLSVWSIDQGWNRTFYFLGLVAAFGMTCCVLSTGAALRHILIQKQWLRSFYSGFDWAVCFVLGIFVYGNLGILGSLLNINNPLWYTLGLTLITGVSALFLGKQISLLRSPFLRMWHYACQQQWKWLWGIPVILWISRALASCLLVNGTEQLHNTLPFAKYLFRGTNFNEYELDTHFLLMGVYEHFSLFLRAFSENDFSYQLLAQTFTFMGLSLSLICLLGSFPLLLRKHSGLAVVFASWPLTINFASSDTLAFKPDWFAVLACAIAWGYFFKQVYSRCADSKSRYMKGVVSFAAIGTSIKMTAIPFHLFLLPTSVLFSIYWGHRIKAVHLWMPVVFFLMASPFFVKNTLWIGNPLFPAFQNVFPKNEKLSNTRNFNEFKVNKNTLKVPDWQDYLYGYLRFFTHHKEFFLSFILAGYLLLLRRSSCFHNEGTGLLALGILVYFLGYTSLMNFYFYPDIYQRFMAYNYILLLSLSLWGLLEYRKHATVPAWRGIVVLFGLLVYSHSHIDANLARSVDWWGKGVSPKEYRIQMDPVDYFYHQINEHCPSPGRLLNRHHRNYLYADFDTVSLIDLQGSAHHHHFFERYHVNFVILERSGPVKTETLEAQIVEPWFTNTFSVILEKGHLELWKRNTYTKCMNSPINTHKES